MNDPKLRRALDEVADLYLTGPDPVRIDLPRSEPRHPRAADPSLAAAAPPAASPASDDITIQAVLLGHLPGYASPWVSQHIDSLATVDRAAALLRLDPRQIEIDLFGDMTVTPQESDLRTTLENLASIVGSWAVLIEDAHTSAARRHLSQLPRWVLLSGADELALEAAGRMIRSLLVDGSISAPPMGIGVMFMGCDGTAARLALRTLADMVGDLLPIPLDLVGFRQRMGPTRRRTIARFGLNGLDPWSILGPFLAEAIHLNPTTAHSQPQAGTQRSAVPPPETNATTRTPQAGTQRSAVPDIAPLPNIAPSVLTFDAINLPDISAIITAPQTETEQPTPQSETQQPAPQAGTERSAVPGISPDISPQTSPDISAPIPLAHHIDLHPLAARSPHHPGIELALDDDGRLHLLALVTPTADFQSTLAHLTHVQHWLTDHRSLIALTSRDRAIADAPPLLHLFTADPKPALPLALAGVFKLHLLKHVPGLPTPLHTRLV
jgi:hypothetical protein